VSEVISLTAARADSAATPDENNPGPSRIVFQEKKSKPQESFVPGTFDPPVVGGEIECEKVPASEYFPSLPLGPISIKTLPISAEYRPNNTREPTGGGAERYVVISVHSVPI
jgi:hypothetical protein